MKWITHHTVIFVKDPPNGTETLWSGSLVTGAIGSFVRIPTGPVWAVNSLGRKTRIILDEAPEIEPIWRMTDGVSRLYINGIEVQPVDPSDLARRRACGLLTFVLDPPLVANQLPCFICADQVPMSTLSINVQFEIRAVADLPTVIAGESLSKFESRQRMALFADALDDPSLLRTESTPSEIMNRAQRMPIDVGLYLPIEVERGSVRISGILAPIRSLGDRKFECLAWFAAELGKVDPGTVICQTARWIEGTDDKKATAVLGRVI